MVRKHTHNKRRLACLVAVLATSLPLGIRLFTPVLAESTTNNITFEVNVKEALTVSVTTPDSDHWASGNANDFLRNIVNVNVESNNPNGFTASMTSASTVEGAPLTNTAATSNSTISTLASGASWTRDNTSITKFWGYSVNDDEEQGTYRPVPLKTGTPVTLTPDKPVSAWSDDVYFGALADYTVDSGTYVGTVLINVVTGVVNSDTNPIVPTNPADPSDDTSDDGEATYTGAGTTTGTGTSGNNGTTIYTTTSSSATNNTTTVATTVTEGDVRSSYSDPAGVTTVNEGTPLATGLAATSAVAAATGIVFFIVAKRRKDEEDEEEY